MTLDMLYMLIAVALLMGSFTVALTLGGVWCFVGGILGGAALAFARMSGLEDR